MKFILAVLLFISTSSFADEWTTGDTYREATFLTFLATDWAQTRNLLRYSRHYNQSALRYYRYHEQNPLLGRHPEQSHLDAAVILTGLAHVYIASVLPEKYRAPFQYVSIGVELKAVTHNFSIGINAKF
jgi:hypothetical protein